jgi:hypothetical protein
MRFATRHLYASLAVAAVLGPASMQVSSFALGPEPAQVELDRIVSRVAGRIITLSDVRQARELRLVEDTSSDAAAVRALENRWLILGEIGRAAPLPPASEAEMAARRAEWQAAAGGRAAAMSDVDVQAWLRDDLRIRAYLDRQFGMLPEGERGRARAEWIGRLRQRAELD